MVENLQQEFEIEIHAHSYESNHLNIGDKFVSLFRKSFGPSIRISSIDDCTKELDLIGIYYHFVQVLMHSSPDSVEQLQRDGDPQVFE